MPSHALSEAVQTADLLSWPGLYHLRDRFQVTITALKIRLERLGLLYVAADGQLFPSRQEYDGQMRLIQEGNKEQRSMPFSSNIVELQFEWRTMKKLLVNARALI